MAGLVLATASASMLRQQRSVRWTSSLNGGEAQMRPLLQLLPNELAHLDPSAGDLAPGQASDSTLQLRAVVATSFACDSATSSITLTPDATSAVAIGGVARLPAAGDSLWFAVSDSAGWQPRRIVAIARVSAGCLSPPLPAGPSYRLTLDGDISAPGATPVRITRHERFVVYRASDARWYLGLRDWSDGTGRFAAPQPIAGPFISALANERTGFRYFDGAGSEIVPNGSNESSVRRVRVSSLISVPSRGAADSVRRDSVDVALAGRGAP